jgi:hypothetical protein
LLFAQCSSQHTVETEDVVLARVGEHELYESQVAAMLPTDIAEDDTSAVRSEVIDNWIRETTLIDQAHAILSDAERDKSDLVSQYYNDLIIHEMKEKMLSQRLDTVVSEDGIEAYYMANRKNFELKENIVRLRFFSIPQSIKNHDKLWRKFKGGKEKDLLAMKRLCELSKSNYFYNDSTWLSFNDVLKELPITTYNQENYLNNNRFIRLNENGYTYFVRILAFRVKNNTSPLEFEKDRIKNIIIHKRKVELLQQIEDEIVREAYANQKIEKF